MGLRTTLWRRGGIHPISLIPLGMLARWEKKAIPLDCVRGSKVGPPHFLLADKNPGNVPVAFYQDVEQLFDSLEFDSL